MSYYDKYLDAAVLRGKTLTAISQIGNDRIEISTDDGKRYALFHSQDCCESVEVHDVAGDLQSLLGSPLTVAREEIGEPGNWPEDVPKPYSTESFTWTSYFFETDTAKVRIRWFGQSNGYYSEGVSMAEVT